ncbi:MAG TPA: cation:proton antiporter, partial [Mycobacterium sp.]|nr:cation:proton antiporter [Mycobacterium sp.]
MELTTVLLRAMDRRQIQRTRRVNFRQRTVSSWAGFRGAVSLAAALAVPMTTRNGAPFPDRSLIIFVVSAVILVTVLVQGSTLPAVVRWANLPEDVARADELRLARERAAQAALEALPQVAGRVGADDDVVRRLQQQYEKQAQLVAAQSDTSEPNDLIEKYDLIRQIRLGVLEHQRRAVTELRDKNLIDDIVLRELQAEMDLEEVRLLAPADSE